jgi:toxin ParE1/3/4
LKVRFTPTARHQFLQALDFIRRDRPMAAARFREVCEDSLRRLVDFPESGRSIPEFPELPHREVIVAPYRFFYRTSGDTVWILAVWHGAQIPADPATDPGA